MIDSLVRSYLISKGINDIIYIGYLPATPDRAVALTLTAGLMPDTKHQYDSTGLQVRTRAPMYTDAQDMIFSIYSHLQSLSTTTISGMFISDIQAQQSPFVLGRDEQNRSQWAQNFIIYYYYTLEHRV